MSAIEKTKALKRIELPIDALVPNPDNPNRMKDKEFNLLVDNLQRTGLTDPIMVRPIEDGKYRIVSGHHRYDAAVYLEFETVPCVIVELDDEEELSQLVRMNTIHGRMDPEKFMKLHSQLSQKYSDEILQDMLGFADEAEFQRLIKSTKKSLPPEMKKAFDEGAKEIKTIDDLAKLLNSLFTRYGDTLPYQFMYLDSQGKDCLWLRISKKTYDACFVLGDICRDKKRTMDDLFGFLLQSIAKGEQPELLDAAVAASKEVMIPTGLPVMPTKENIAAVSML